MQDSFIGVMIAISSISHWNMTLQVVVYSADKAADFIYL